jgi:hypothetical protein
MGKAGPPPLLQLGRSIRCLQRVLPALQLCPSASLWHVQRLAELPLLGRPLTLQRAPRACRPLGTSASLFT